MALQYAMFELGHFSFLYGAIIIGVTGCILKPLLYHCHTSSDTDSLKQSGDITLQPDSTRGKIVFVLHSANEGSESKLAVQVILQL